MGSVIRVGLGVVGGLLLLWLILLAVLWRCRPAGGNLREAVRLIPDVVRLIKRLAVDPAMPRGLRIRLSIGLGYLLLPIDLVPDFLPVIGYADDAVVVALLLRSVIRAAGVEALTSHWPGSPEGLATVSRLAGSDVDVAAPQRPEPPGGGAPCGGRN